MSLQGGSNPAGKQTPIRPLRISESARSLLQDMVPIVMMTHQSGLSLMAPGSCEIVYLGPPGNGLLPLHVIVRHRDLARLIHQLGTTNSEEHYVELDLDGVRGFRLEFERPVYCLQDASARAAVDQLAEWLRMRPDNCGLGESVADALSSRGRVRTTLAMVAAEAPGALDELRALIGRGAGSTPAGDDMLVGALAFAFASGAHDTALVKAMNALAPRFERLTTATGATYLRAATRGAFGSDLMAFVRSLPVRPMAQVFHRAMRVAAHGATSGVDSLIGFVAAHDVARCAVDGIDGATVGRVAATGS